METTFEGNIVHEDTVSLLFSKKHMPSILEATNFAHKFRAQVIEIDEETEDDVEIMFGGSHRGIEKLTEKYEQTYC